MTVGPGPVRSLWLQEALATEDDMAPQLEGNVRADVCVVGGGYTGLWTALRLKEAEPALGVVILESDVCGGGASGRNGGFVLSWWSKFGTLAKLFGVGEALRLARASAEAVSAIGVFCSANGVDAHFREDGYLWAATNPAQVGAWLSTVEELDRHGEHPFEELDRDEVARRAGSPVHLAGVLESSGAIVQPALLARGLRRVALRRGIRIHEGTPMTSIEHGVTPKVVTPRGSVRAERVVLALNAWGSMFRQIRSRVVVIGSDIVATEPIPERLTEIGWTDGLCISDARLLVHYYRTTADGRIAFGKGGGALAFGARIGDRFEGRPRRVARVVEGFHRIFPKLRGARIATSWTGPIDRTRTGLPFFAPLGRSPNVVFGVGYSGNGVGPSYLGGKILASLALGRDDEWARCGLVGLAPQRFPPEPIRFAGGLVVRSAIERKERLEDGGQKADPITRALVRLAPAGLVPVERD